jgi:crossover junction endodeoxyribonuclease RuvC
MFEPVVLGVDPGTASVGLAVVALVDRRPSIVWASTLRTPPGMPAAERLRRIHRGAAEVIDLHDPYAMAIERLMFGRNTQSAMGVARASGALMLAAAEAGIPVEEYAPLEVKMAITGVGNAPKEQVRRSLSRISGVADVPADPDAADAVAVAICHLQQSRLRGLVAAQGAR